MEKMHKSKSLSFHKSHSFKVAQNVLADGEVAPTATDRAVMAVAVVAAVTAMEADIG